MSVNIDPLYIISFSGGAGSAASLLLAHKLKLNYISVFADTLIEDEDLYRFMEDIERVTSTSVIRLSTGMTPWDVYVKERYIGNSRTAHCSQRLKTDVVRQFINEFYSTENPVLVLGMSYEEKERIDRAKQKWSPIPVTSLLVEHKINSRCSIEELINEFGVVMPRLYSYGFPHNNCGGFCCRSGQTQFATLLQHFPERYEWHVQQERKAYTAIGKTAKPFIRVTINKMLHYLTMEEFREKVQSGELRPNSYEYGGCACFVDEVEQ